VLGIANFLEVVGHEKYVFVEVYSKVDDKSASTLLEFNQLYEYYMGPRSSRNDIIVAKIDADENSFLCQKLQVVSFPEFILFRPNDFTYPIDFRFEQTFTSMRDFIETFPVYIPTTEERRISELRDFEKRGFKDKHEAYNDQNIHKEIQTPGGRKQPTAAKSISVLN